MGAGIPDLVTVDDELVSLKVGIRSDRTEVGAGTGFRQEQAPAFFAAQRLGQVTQLLLLARMRQHHRTEYRDVGDGRARQRHLFVEDRQLDVAKAGAAVLFGPGDAKQAGVGKCALPLLQEFVIRLYAGLRSSGARGVGRQIFLYKVADSLAKGFLLWGVVEIHGYITRDLSQS